MLILLTKEQTATAFETIKAHIMATLPLQLKDNFKPGAFLMAVEKNLAQVWVNVDDNGVIDAVVTTTVSFDMLSERKMFHIYTLSSSDNLSLETLRSGLRQLEIYARQIGCSGISASIVNPRVIHLAEKLGFSAAYGLLEKEI